jgi:hypothetical protein
MNHLTFKPVTALYARRSRRRDSEYPSCDAQIDMCRLYALSQGWENCVAFVDDDKSGETLERAALKQMLLPQVDKVLETFRLDLLREASNES